MPMLTSFDIFKHLKGTWSFYRTITNRLTPACSGVVLGSATFTAVEDSATTTLPARLYYEEHGEFTLKSGMQASVTKGYHYEYNSNKDNIEVYFSQDKTKQELFHILSSEQLSAEHVCINDLYNIKYKFNDKHFSIQYTAKGPNKDYDSYTVFNKIG
jgi:hypothetical protein